MKGLLVPFLGLVVTCFGHHCHEWWSTVWLQIYQCVYSKVCHNYLSFCCSLF